MSTSLYDALAAVGLARTDDDQPTLDSASEQPQSKKLSADDFALLQRLADTFPACFNLQRPVPLMPDLDMMIRQHPDFRLVSLTSLDNVLAFVTGRRPAKAPGDTPSMGHRESQLNPRCDRQHPQH